MNIRSFEPADLEQVIAVHAASVHTLAAPFYTAEQLAAWAPPNPDVGLWQKRLATHNTFVAEQNGVIVGFISYKLNGHLDLIFTHPAFALQGVATSLYRRVESALCAAGVSRVFTEASLAAQRFFEHCGFQTDVEELVDCGGVQLRRYVMHKQIRAA